jgi:hypothetical protein
MTTVGRFATVDEAQVATDEVWTPGDGRRCRSAGMIGVTVSAVV